MDVEPDKTLGRVGSISRKPVPTPRSTLRKPGARLGAQAQITTPPSEGQLVGDDILSALEGIPGVGSLRSLNKAPKSPPPSDPGGGGAPQSAVPSSTSITSLPNSHDHETQNKTARIQQRVPRDNSSQSLRLPSVYKKDEKIR